MAPIAKTQITKSGDNAIPAEYAAEGYDQKVATQPVYYQPDGAGPLHCVIVDRTTQPSIERNKEDQIVFHGLVLVPFKNGHNEDGVQGDDCNVGDVIRITERNQLQVLGTYVKRERAVLIVAKGKVASRKNKTQTVWLFDVFSRALLPHEKKAAIAAIGGQSESAPLLTE